jgi:predicted metalloprotease with PDZ domain
VNGHIPIRSADKTSCYLHELFWQLFRPGPDGRWVSEGLAEYYSLALQRRARRLSERSFARGVALFARYGRWGLDLSHTHEPAALNNSAPFVMFSLDQEIRAASAGERSLDDVVGSLARDGGVLTTPGFLSAVNRAAGRDLSARFARAVLRGERPPYVSRAPGA